MKLKNYLFILIGIIFISSCKKAELDSASSKLSPTALKSAQKDTGVDVYVVGLIYALNGHPIAVYWKNGVLNRLSDSVQGATANGVAVYGSDVYISGALTDANGNALAAVYWKNGVMTKLADSAAAAAIAISSAGDVYIGGTLTPSTSHYIPVYWKNGVRQSLESHSPIVSVYDIAVQGNDVYLAGTGITTQKTVYGLYWKNGVAHNLTDTLSFSETFSIAVEKNNVYVSGQSPQSNSGVVYWKNGLQTVLHDPNRPDYAGGSIGIGVKNNKVYLSAEMGNDGSYWVNGKATYLSTSAVVANAGRLTLFGNDGYVVGSAVFYSNSSKPVAAYWKNGSLVVLPTPNGGVGLSGGGGLGIAVVPHVN